VYLKIFQEVEQVFAYRYISWKWCYL